MRTVCICGEWPRSEYGWRCPSCPPNPVTKERGESVSMTIDENRRFSIICLGMKVLGTVREEERTGRDGSVKAVDAVNGMFQTFKALYDWDAEEDDHFSRWALKATQQELVAYATSRAMWPVPEKIASAQRSKFLDLAKQDTNNEELLVSAPFRIVKGDQEVHFTEVVNVVTAGSAVVKHVLKVEIRSDFYRKHSFAKIHRWGDTKWRLVENVAYGEMKTPPGLRVVPQDELDGGSHFRIDRNELLVRASAVLQFRTSGRNLAVSFGDSESV